MTNRLEKYSKYENSAPCALLLCMSKIRTISNSNNQTDTNYRQRYIHDVYVFCNIYTAQHNKRQGQSCLVGMRYADELCGVFFFLFHFLLSKFFINDRKKQRITFCLYHIGFSLLVLLLYFHSTLIAFLLIPK